MSKLEMRWKLPGSSDLLKENAIERELRSTSPARTMSVDEFERFVDVFVQHKINVKAYAAKEWSRRKKLDSVAQTNRDEEWDVMMDPKTGQDARVAPEENIPLLVKPNFGDVNNERTLIFDSGDFCPACGKDFSHIA